MLELEQAVRDLLKYKPVAPNATPPIKVIDAFELILAFLEKQDRMALRLKDRIRRLEQKEKPPND